MIHQPPNVIRPADRLQLVVASGVSLATLVIAAMLSIYKPHGQTPFAKKNGKTIRHKAERRSGTKRKDDPAQSGKRICHKMSRKRKAR